MAETAPVEMKPTLGLTGLTMNAMALIAPGAFLWLTFAGQAAYGATTPAMWIGIVFALLLCLATAVCYAEMAKLYPGTGSSYYFAEQAFLNHDKAWPYARSAKFVVGWGSHLYYWVYPGVMVGVIGVISGYGRHSRCSFRLTFHQLALIPGFWSLPVHVHRGPTFPPLTGIGSVCGDSRWNCPDLDRGSARINLIPRLVARKGVLPVPSTPSPSPILCICGASSLRRFSFMHCNFVKGIRCGWATNQGNQGIKVLVVALVPGFSVS